MPNLLQMPKYANTKLDSKLSWPNKKGFQSPFDFSLSDPNFKADIAGKGVDNTFENYEAPNPKFKTNKSFSAGLFDDFVAAGNDNSGTVTTPTVKPPGDNTVEPTVESKTTNPFSNDIMKNAVNEYMDDANKMYKQGSQANATTALLNTGVLINEMMRKPGDPYKGATLKSPDLFDPSFMIDRSMKDSASQTLRMSLRQLRETGQTELIPQVLANYGANKNKIAATTASARADYLNKQGAMDADVANKNAEIEANTHNQNIQKIMQENAMSGQISQQAMQAIAATGVNQINMGGQIAANKFMKAMATQDMTNEEKVAWINAIRGLSDVPKVGE